MSFGLVDSLYREGSFEIVCCHQIWKDKERITITSQASGLSNGKQLPSTTYHCSPSLRFSRPFLRILF
jgi:hypothetical protein